MGYLQWMLSIFSLVGLSTPQSFISSPPDISSMTGVDIYLPCEADLGSANYYFEWLEHITDHTGKKIYDSRNPDNIQGGRQAKFAVNGTKPSSSGRGTHNLIIKNAEVSDGGTYSARITTAEGITAKSEVLIFENPSIELASQTWYENRTEEIRCIASFGGPTMNVVKDSQKPRVEILINNLGIEATESYVPGDPGKQAHKITMKANLAVTWEHHGQLLQCSVSTTDPGFQRIREQTLDVKFYVRDIRISPNTPTGGARLVLSVGEHLNCTANGNEEPEIQWHPITVPTVPPGGAPIPPTVRGMQLPIQPNMVGDNTWQCLASNLAGGDSKTISSSIEFTVVPATPAPIIDGASVPLPRIQTLLFLVLAYLLRTY